MSDYSIHVENGKVVGNSVFYRIANDRLAKPVLTRHGRKERTCFHERKA